MSVFSRPSPVLLRPNPVSKAEGRLEPFLLFGLYVVGFIRALYMLFTKPRTTTTAMIIS